MKKAIAVILFLNLSLYGFWGSEYVNYDAKIRLGYLNIDTEANNTSTLESIGALINIGVATNPINGLSLAVRGYYMFNIGSNDYYERTPFSDTNGTDFILIGEAFLKYQAKRTIFKYGRQIINTPYMNQNDIGMIPNLYNGALLVNKDIRNTTIAIAYIDQHAGLNATQIDNFNSLVVDSNQSSGTGTVFGVLFNGVVNTKMQLWYYLMDRYAELLYFDAIVDLRNFTLGFQQSTQSDKNFRDTNGADGSIFGFYVDYHNNIYKIKSAFNSVSGNGVMQGYGKSPFFTTLTYQSIADYTDNTAYMFGIEYNFKDILFDISYLKQKSDKSELDASVSYDFTKDLSGSLNYSGLDSGDKIVRSFIKYRF